MVPKKFIMRKWSFFKKMLILERNLAWQNINNLGRGTCSNGSSMAFAAIKAIARRNKASHELGPFIQYSVCVSFRGENNTSREQKCQMILWIFYTHKLLQCLIIISLNENQWFEMIADALPWPVGQLVPPRSFTYVANSKTIYPDFEINSYPFKTAIWIGVRKRGEMIWNFQI